MKRQVDYAWPLPEIMAAHGMHNSTELIPRLAERGIQLSRPQVYRVVHQRPERVSLQLLAALCDIFGCMSATLSRSLPPRCVARKPARRPPGLPMLLTSTNRCVPVELG
jgi:Cro/C1-type HTH DNA-binding domain